MWMDVAHVAAYAEVAERDAWKDGSGYVPLAAGDDLKDGVDAEEMVAAAEEVIEQVELADDVEKVQQLGGGVEDDEIVATSIAADEAMQTA